MPTSNFSRSTLNLLCHFVSSRKFYRSFHRVVLRVWAHNSSRRIENHSADILRGGIVERAAPSSGGRFAHCISSLTHSIIVGENGF
jgi:hypothetical protein